MTSVDENEKTDFCAHGRTLRVQYLAIRHNMDVGRELELDEQLQDLSKQLGRSQASAVGNLCFFKHEGETKNEQ